MTDLFASAEDATPIDEDVAAGLKADWIATREELNKAEQENILQASTWALGRRKRWTVTEIGSATTLKMLHRRMLGSVWKWAGEWRRSEVNIGPSYWLVPQRVEELCADLRAQAPDITRLAYPAPEVAVRFHHRLVAIHPFPNGNGRHARLCADLVVLALGGDELTWGGGESLSAGAARDRYIRALQRADSDYDYQPLLDFAMS